MNKQMRHFRFLAKPLLRGESMCSKCYQEADRTFPPSDILWLTNSPVVQSNCEYIHIEGLIRSVLSASILNST